MSQVCRLEQAVEEMRVAITDLTGLDASQFTITVQPLLDPDTWSALAEVQRLQRETDQVAAICVTGVSPPAGQRRTSVAPPAEQARPPAPLTAVS